MQCVVDGVGQCFLQVIVGYCMDVDIDFVGSWFEIFVGLFVDVEDVVIGIDQCCSG